MARVAPKGRKHLSADALLAQVRRSFETIPDHRLSHPEISLPDALMAAFALYALKSPSLLAFDHQRTEGNLHTIYGIERVPCDTAMREILDPVAPAALRPVFTRIFRQLQRGKALEPLTFLDGHYLVALDGTGYFSSKTIHCASCLHKVHRNGSITYAHQMVGAAIIHPDFRTVIPLMPEPIVKQDGTEKNDCERNATKRLIAQLRHDHPHLSMIVTEDSLSSNAPHIETLQEYGCHYILGVKEGDHAYLFEQVQAAVEAGRGTEYERRDRATGLVHRFRFLNALPLNESHAEVRVNCVAPGNTATPRITEARSASADDLATGRLDDYGSTSDVASAILFLSCDLSRHVNGQTLAVEAVRGHGTGVGGVIHQRQQR